MIRRIAFFLTVAIGMCACGAPPEPVAEQNAALYVDQNGGQGPFATDGSDPIWTRGEIEMWANRFTPFRRWIGNMGDRFYVAHPSTGYTWIRMSTDYTVATAREFEYQNGTFGGRYYQATSAWHNIAADGWSPQAVQVRYYPPCPPIQGYTVVHACTGAYTPYDSGGSCPNGNCSPLPTVVIGDGAVQPGLPYGNPLKLTPAADPAGQRVECIADLATYGLGTGLKVAVYGCP